MRPCHPQRNFARFRDAALRPSIWKRARSWRGGDEAGSMAIYDIDGAEAGEFEITDSIRPEAAAAVRRLHDMGIAVWLLSGDRREIALRVALEAGIQESHVIAEAMPAEKEFEIARLSSAGGHVAMVGDGINDAPVLARATTTGIAIGAGTDVAIEAGAIVLMRADLTGVPEALELARRTMRVIRQNLFWAFAYNAIGIPIAAGVLYRWTGWTLSPMLASAAMALSSVSVVSNSLRLRNTTSEPGL